MEHFRKVLSRRLERDMGRIEEYYANLLNEVGQRRRSKKEKQEENKDEIAAKESAARLDPE